jgi:hypothetical protein
MTDKERRRLNRKSKVPAAHRCEAGPLVAPPDGRLIHQQREFTIWRTPDGGAVIGIPWPPNLIGKDRRSPEAMAWERKCGRRALDVIATLPNDAGLT